VELVSADERDSYFGTFRRVALHLEMRDTYGVPNEADRFARFLETGGRGDTAEATDDDRRTWLTMIRNAVQAGKTVRRARIVSEPVTDYIRFEWAGTVANVKAGEEVRWLPRRLASTIALPGNDFWLFDEETVVFTIFTGAGRVAERQRTTDPAAVRLCASAFEAVWSAAIPHEEYRLR
jgi:hypothetical protein